MNFFGVGRDAAYVARRVADRVRELGRRGHAHVARHHDWTRLKGDFVAALEQFAQRGR